HRREAGTLRDPLHLLDCCIISDGGGALVVTSAARARDLRKPPVRVLGCGEAVAHQEVGAPDLLTIAARQSGAQALAMAGVRHSELDLAALYDSFTITVLLTLENLGFCKPGEGGSFVEGGRIGLGGELPVNPDGGGLSSNHPGRGGIFLLTHAAPSCCCSAAVPAAPSSTGRARSASRASRTRSSTSSRPGAAPCTPSPSR